MKIASVLTGATNVNKAITSAASKYGVSPDYMRVVAHLESKGDPNAQNPRSSAGGLFQFIDSTAKDYGLSNKKDPYASSDAAARLMRDNAKGLRAVLGREPNAGELYLAHQQGLGGARKLLRDPGAKAVDVVGAAAVKLNGGSADMTAGEFANLWMRKANNLSGESSESDFSDVGGSSDILSGGGFDDFATGGQGEDILAEADLSDIYSSPAALLDEILEGEDEPSIAEVYASPADFLNSVEQDQGPMIPRITDGMPIQTTDQPFLI